MTMSNDLKTQLRALVDTAAPVSAGEAKARAATRLGGVRVEPASSHTHPARRWGRPVAVAASVMALAGAGSAWAITAGSRPPAAGHGERAAAAPKVVLTAAELHAITARSGAAASTSGTAEVAETSSENGAPQGGYDVAVTFSGRNVDEKVTSVPEPPGSAPSFTTDDRLVAGQFYIYTPGPGDVLEWLHDTNSANDVASMQFPDPRTLFDAISPKAQFAAVGTTTMQGKTVTELVAGDPSAIDPAALGNLAAGDNLTSFELWVGSDDVVQRIALSTSLTSQVCKVLPLTQAKRRDLLQRVGETATLPDGEGDCGPTTTLTHFVVSFADLGVPQSVTAPQHAVDFTGKG
ncbi:MAG: hypothetical protein ACRDV8_07640 [Acidimicrobiales bacterium]